MSGAPSTAMRSVDVIEGGVRAAGIVELEPTDRGIALHRMPRWARTRHNDLTLPLIESMPSGGRLEMTTDATRLELDVKLTLLKIGTDPLRPAAFDLVLDGRVVAAATTETGTVIAIDARTGDIDVQSGPSTTVTFDGIPAGRKHLELWLPHNAAVRLLDLRVDGSIEPPPPTTRRWVHYGSSISHCSEADRPTGTWPAVAARLAGVDLQSFGFGGQCQLDPFAGRMIAEQPAYVISLKLGINIVNADSMRERTFVPALHGLLDTIRESHPEVPVVLITPIVCPVAEDHPGPTITDAAGQCAVIPRPAGLSVGALTLRRIRELEAEIVEARRQGGDLHLHLLRGPDLFGEDDVPDLPDGLHPNAAGYQRMGERFHQLVFVDGPFKPDARVVL